MNTVASNPPAMNSEEITVVAHGSGRLHVRFSATVKVSDSPRLFADIGQRALAEKAVELLIDARAIQEKLSMIRRLQMVIAFVTHLRGYRVAGVFSEATVDPNRIGETMARNRGANVRVFTRLAEAQAWLGWCDPE